jgi:hypothetical protein
LFERREVMVPTGWAWMLLVVVAGLAFYTTVRRLHGFLAPERPVGTGVLVVEGWLDDAAFDAALTTWKSGAYQRIVTTGGPVGQTFLAPFRTYADRGAARLRERGVPKEAIAVVAATDADRDRAVAAAMEVRRWLESQHEKLPVEGLDVFSQGARARRIWAIYRRILGDLVPVGVHSAPPSDYEPESWWRSGTGARRVLGEAAGWAWVACCLRPDLAPSAALGAGSGAPTAAAQAPTKPSP